MTKLLEMNGFRKHDLPLPIAVSSFVIRYFDFFRSHSLPPALRTLP
jgi:hypothetical protein